ncbi:Peptidase S1 domain-containing protein [Trichostrongylus colubriformis]|uniref:Peptidase S1 domain-containing protein n=1 Tax=Trichostrongylus colubriformis TaxID=6319 RepID=A0AAN8FY92_TRICO
MTNFGVLAVLGLGLIYVASVKKVRLGKISEMDNKILNTICHRSELKVMSGKRVKNDEMKYAVMIEINKGEKLCSGVLISRQHVLTSAHCFVNAFKCRARYKYLRASTLSSPHDLLVQVHVGGNCAVLQGNKNGCQGGKIMSRIKAVHIGVPRLYFASRCRSGDIAIVELAKPLPHDRRFAFACLPSNTTKLHKKAQLSGFGWTQSGKVKYAKKITLTKERFCDPSTKVGKDVFCMQESEGFACKGDSGSGVMQPANSREYTVMGLLSKALDCNYKKLAMKRHGKRVSKKFRGVVITDTRKYLDWICLHSGVCERHIERKRMKKRRIVMIY